MPTRCRSQGPGTSKLELPLAHDLRQFLHLKVGEQQYDSPPVGGPTFNGERDLINGLVYQYCTTMPRYKWIDGFQHIMRRSVLTS
jgi:hypothetical protein